MPFTEHDNEDPGDFAAFFDMLEVYSNNDCRANFIFVKYSNLEAEKMRAVFDHLHEAFEQKCPLLWTGQPRDTTDLWTLCFFQNVRKFDVPCFDEREPEVFKISVRDLGNCRFYAARILAGIKAYAKCLVQSCGTFAVVNSDIEWTADLLESAVADLTHVQLQRLYMDAQLREEKKRTSFQLAFIKTYSTIVKLKTQSVLDRQRSSQVVLHGPGDPKLKLTDLVNLDQVVTRLNEVTGEAESFTLMHYIKTPALFLSYALLIIGPDGTTGFGKSLAALVIAMYWLRCFLSARKLPADAAYALLQNTLDAMRDSQPLQRPYIPVILDEFKPADKEQNQYCSQETIKSLVNISKPRDIRARSDQVRLHANQPVIMTANAEDEHDWCKARFDWSLPCARKTFVLKLRMPLLPDSIREQGAGGSSEVHEGLADCMHDE